MKNDCQNENFVIDKQIQKLLKDNTNLKQELRQIIQMAKEIENLKPNKKKEQKISVSQNEIIEKSNQEVNIQRNKINVIQSKISTIKSELFQNDNFVHNKELQNKISYEINFIEDLKKKNQKLVEFLNEDENINQQQNIFEDIKKQIEDKKKEVQKNQQSINEKESQNSEVFKKIVKNQQKIQDLKNNIILAKSSKFQNQLDQISKESIENILKDFREIKEKEQQIKQSITKQSQEHHFNMQKLEQQEKQLMQQIEDLKKKVHVKKVKEKLKNRKQKLKPIKK